MICFDILNRKGGNINEKISVNRNGVRSPNSLLLHRRIEKKKERTPLRLTLIFSLIFPPFLLSISKQIIYEITFYKKPGFSLVDSFKQQLYFFRYSCQSTSFHPQVPPIALAIYLLCIPQRLS